MRLEYYGPTVTQQMTDFTRGNGPSPIPGCHGGWREATGPFETIVLNFLIF
jgi:hypothetical protein